MEHLKVVNGTKKTMRGSFQPLETEIMPLVYEPCFKHNPLHKEKPACDGISAKVDDDRVGNTKWCSCSLCCQMPTAEESVCCKEIKNANAQLQDGTCIACTSDFKAICLNEERVFLTFRILGTTTKKPPMDKYNRMLRKTAYRIFSCWIHGYLGPRNQRPIPACVVKAIRAAFPDPKGTYTGFIQIDDYAAVDMATEF